MPERPEQSPEERRFPASRSSGEVSALFLRPENARAILTLAHGAGAGMRHSFLEALAGSLAGRGIATLRFQFPYTEKGGRRPDPEPVLRATVRAALAHAREAAPDLPLFAGGKSMGGRMTSLAMADAGAKGADRDGADAEAKGADRDGADAEAKGADRDRALAEVRGLVFFGFPLHAPKKPSDSRADHLARVSVPMLFLQGTRDDLAGLDLIQSVCARLGSRARLEVIEGADHSFHVLKKSVRTDREVLEQLSGAVLTWMEKQCS